MYSSTFKLAQNQGFGLYTLFYVTMFEFVFRIRGRTRMVGIHFVGVYINV